ncbi:hypothetical protein thsps21_26860 [Pseudomonas sp. No.21]|nr:hypothetical protein TUM20249_11600 [Pseudomonas tohonis]
MHILLALGLELADQHAVAVDADVQRRLEKIEHHRSLEDCEPRATTGARQRYAAARPLVQRPTAVRPWEWEMVPMPGSGGLEELGNIANEWALPT